MVAFYDLHCSCAYITKQPKSQSLLLLTQTAGHCHDMCIILLLCLDLRQSRFAQAVHILCNAFVLQIVSVLSLLPKSLLQCPLHFMCTTVQLQ